MAKNKMKSARKFSRIPLIYYLHQLTILSHIAVIFGSMNDRFFPTQDNLLQILSTGSEVIAGLYGITLSGYVFFLSRIDGLASSDVTLEDVVYDMKQRYKYMIWGISINVLMALIGCGVIQYYPTDSGIISDYFYRLICNEALLFMFSSVIFIFYYTLSVINPRSLEKAAINLKKKLSRDTITGDISQFFADYEKIDVRCMELLNHETQAHLNRIGHCNSALVHDVLREQGNVNHHLLDDIVSLRRYHNCLLHCKQMTVSQEMCDLAKNVLEKLSPPQKTVGISRTRMKP